MKTNFLEEPGEVMTLESAIALGMIDLGAEVEPEAESEFEYADRIGEGPAVFKNGKWHPGA